MEDSADDDSPGMIMADDHRETGQRSTYSGGFPPGYAYQEFPFLEEPGRRDIEVLERQMKAVRGNVLIAARCCHRRPAVVLTEPFSAGGDAFTPLLWLSCPYLDREIGRLESEGSAKKLAGMIESDTEIASLFFREDRRFAEIHYRLALSVKGEGAACRVRDKGVAGGSAGSVKCLHAHLAYRLAAGRGIVGDWCLEELAERGGVWCGEIPDACLD